MKKLLILFIVTSMFAYQKDDNVDIGLAKKIEMESEKIYVVDFFASWCASCKKELPLISHLQQNLDASRVEIVGVDVDEELLKGQVFQKDLQLSFRVVDDTKGEIVKVFNPVGMPAIYIIKESKVIEVIVGAKDHIDVLLSDKLKALEL